ncbi:MAG: nucleotidyltransferase domain-containing protein [Gammaproteobacteria bacterium]|nr:nucleotidyltransferase domain-containing protein [Gammaproteobacteria bacterium]
MKEIKIDNTLKYFLNEIKLLKDEIISIYLFGSRAKGNFRPDSDYDLLIVVKKKERKFIDGLYEGVINTLLRDGRLMSLKVFEKKQFEYLASIPTPFMERVIKGGVKIG